MTDIRKVLAAEAEDAEANRGDAPRAMVRSRNSAQPASQVYTVRMPVERLAELKALADRSGMPASTLLREWVLERLDEETSRESELSAVRRSLTDALHTLDRLEQQSA